MPTSPNILHTCSNDRRTTNGEAIHHNTACLVRINIPAQVFRARLKLRRRRVLVRYDLGLFNLPPPFENTLEFF